MDEAVSPASVHLDDYIHCGRSRLSNRFPFFTDVACSFEQTVEVVDTSSWRPAPSLFTVHKGIIHDKIIHERRSVSH